MEMNFANQILDWITWIIVKINEILLWISEPIAEKLTLEAQNVHLILLLGISIYIASKITQERGLKLFLIAAVIFAIFWTMGGGAV